MSEELNKVLVETIQKVTSGVDQVVQFGKEQIPEVLEQLLMWHFMRDVLLFVMFTSFFVCGLVWWNKRHKIHLKLHQEVEEGLCRDHDVGFFMIMHYAGIYLLLGVGFIGMVGNMTFIKILIAPKLYLLEYAAKLIGGT